MILKSPIKDDISAICSSLETVWVGHGGRALRSCSFWITALSTVESNIMKRAGK